MLTALKLNDFDLIAATVLKDFSRYPSPLHYWLAYFNGIAVVNHEYLIHFQLITGFCHKRFDVEFVALTHAILFTACFDYCVH